MKQKPDQPDRLTLWHILAGFGWGFLVCLLITMLAGCKTIKYVPVETIKTERVEVHDSIIIADTVRVMETDTTTTTTTTTLQKVDSTYLASLGIINPPPEAWLLQKDTEHTTEHNTNTHTEHNESSTHKADSIRVEYRDRPYPVEKPLTTWQRFCLDYGKITTGATIALILLLALRIFGPRKK